MTTEVNPPVDEDEEEEHHKTGRSAFFAGVHSADSFTGSYRGVKPAPHGGAAYVKPEDTLGLEDLCWCGGPKDHDWRGKDQGDPHPREEWNMTAQSVGDQPRLEMRSLRKWDDNVARMVTELVNTYGVRFRLQDDGNHVLLYPLRSDGPTRPFKVSAKRQAQTQMKYLERWAEDYVKPFLVEHAAEALAEKFNDPSKKTRFRPTTKVSDGPIRKAAQEPAPEPVAPEPTPAPTPPPAPAPAPPAPAPAPTGEPPVPFSGEAPEGWHQYVGYKGGVRPWWEKDDRSAWRCQQCGFETDDISGISGHMRAHNPELFARKRAANHLRKAAEEMGLGDLLADDAKVEKMQRQIDTLTEKVAKVTAERDALDAKLALIREGLSL